MRIELDDWHHRCDIAACNCGRCHHCGEDMPEMMQLWGDGESIQAHFDRWIITEDGKAVEESIMRRVQRLRDQGWTHFGIKALWEVARFDRSLQVGPDKGFKLNNNLHAHMSRYLMDKHPDLDGFFETRRLRAE